MREQEEGIVHGALYTPHPSCCHCQATATGKCQGANLEKGEVGFCQLVLSLRGSHYRDQGTRRRFCLQSPVFQEDYDVKKGSPKCRRDC